jgi:hypothetical protein
MRLDRIKPISIKSKLDIVWKILLVIYFIAITIISVYAIISIWAPESLQSLQPKVTNSTTTFVTLPSTTTTREKYLVEISALFGVLGASVYGLASATVWIAHNKLQRSWILWYVSHPLVGGALAIIFYLIIRGGLIQGITFAINDFAIAAVSAIVGLVTTPAMKKLRDIFDALFGIRKTEEEKGDEPVTPTTKKEREANIKLSIPKSKVKIGEELEIKADVTKKDGTYANNIEVLFNISNSGIVAFKNGGHNDKVTTDFKGLAFATIIGISKGITTITATSILDRENKYGNATIDVTEV